MQDRLWEEHEESEKERWTTRDILHISKVTVKGVNADRYAEVEKRYFKKICQKKLNSGIWIDMMKDDEMSQSWQGIIQESMDIEWKEIAGNIEKQMLEQ